MIIIIITLIITMIIMIIIIIIIIMITLIVVICIAAGRIRRKSRPACRRCCQVCLPMIGPSARGQEEDRREVFGATGRQKERQEPGGGPKVDGVRKEDTVGGNYSA